MTASSKRHTIEGSERQPVTGARAVGAVHPDERLEVTLRLRPKTPLEAAAPRGAQADEPLGQRRYLSREAYAAQHGADPGDLASIEAFARAYGLVVAHADLARRSVVLAGTSADFCKAFDVKLEQFEHQGNCYRGRVGAITVPEALRDIVQGVFGLDDRPQADPHFQIYHPPRGPSPRVPVGFTPVELAHLYDFPAGLDGSGQCIAIIELGGGYRPGDIATYFRALGLPVPRVKAILVDHAHNAPTTADGADGEVMLDIEVAAAVAPQALIAVYFAPNTNQGFLDAVTTAVHDAVNKPSVVSISWGSAETNWTAQAMKQMDQAFQAAAAMGVTVCVAAGDNGSSDGLTDGKAHVDFPASSPHVLGCGGTRLVAAGSRIASEVVWNAGADSATGGGVSDVFPLPGYQRSAHVPTKTSGKLRAGRGVPDVAGDADPATGYRVRVDGKDLVIGGTSAVAPLWAGLIALLNQKLGQPVGFLNPLLYGSLVDTKSFSDITKGNNGSYASRPGWDACTGWGTPNGTRLLEALSAS